MKLKSTIFNEINLESKALIAEFRFSDKVLVKILLGKINQSEKFTFELLAIWKQGMN
jgi:hypothetical protein